MATPAALLECYWLLIVYLGWGNLSAKVTKGDIARPEDRRLGESFSVFALLLRHTKTGNNRWVELRISDTVEILKWYLPHLLSNLARVRLKAKSFVNKRSDVATFSYSNKKLFLIFY